MTVATTPTARSTEMFRAVVGASAEVPKFLLAYIVDVWNRVNATTLRITVTMGVVVTTSMRYQLSGIEIGNAWIKFGTWEPSDSWLMFMAVMAGVDVVQFAAKRFSFKGKDETEVKKTEISETPGGQITAKHEETSTSTLAGKPDAG